MGTVIKAGQQNPTTLRRLETIDLADHLVEAAKIVNSAKRQATRLLGEAKSAADGIRKSADERGYEAGYARGLEEGRGVGHEQAFMEATERYKEQQAQLREMMQAVVNELESAKRDLLIEAEHDLLRFAVRVAEKVAKRAVSLDAKAAEANVREALRLTGSRTDLVVEIHPNDAATMREFAEQYARDVAGGTHIQIVEDAGVSPGGCRLRRGRTEIDATIEAQLEQIVNLLLPQSKDGHR